MTERSLGGVPRIPQSVAALAAAGLCIIVTVTGSGCVHRVGNETIPRMWADDTVYCVPCRTSVIGVDDRGSDMKAGFCCGIPAATVGALLGAGVSLGLGWGGALGGGVVGCLAGGSAYAGASVGRSIFQEKLKPGDSGIPDLNELIISRFAERARAAIPACSTLVSGSRAVPAGTLEHPTTRLELVLSHLALNGSDGFTCRAKACIVRAWTLLSGVSHGADTLWHAECRYNTAKANRMHKLAEFRSDGYSLLKEELSHAADTIAAVFVSSMTRKLR